MNNKYLHRLFFTINIIVLLMSLVLVSGDVYFIWSFSHEKCSPETGGDLMLVLWLLFAYHIVNIADVIFKFTDIRWLIVLSVCCGSIYCLVANILAQIMYYSSQDICVKVEAPNLGLMILIEIISFYAILALYLFVPMVKMFCVH
jgi:hypothetical protein